jgi:DNA-binding transcriptional MerR regulator
MSGLLQIGDVASQTGLTVDAIRFYERERLLHTTARSSGGFRLFSGSDIEDLTFIRNAQELGFSLQEIRELLSLKQKSQPDCRQVEQFLEHKIAVVRRKIAALRLLERELQRAVDDCQSNLRRVADAPAHDCPVLNDISHARGRRKK